MPEGELFNDDGELIFTVATLNIWYLLTKYFNTQIYMSVYNRSLPYPWPIGSKDKDFRIGKFIEALTNSDYDVITLQEVFITHISGFNIY